MGVQSCLQCFAYITLPQRQLSQCVAKETDHGCVQEEQNLGCYPLS